MSILHEWLELLRQQFFAIDALQCAVLVLGISEVLLARANNIWLYPTGIAATALAIYSLLDVQLYAESALHVYYLVMSIYGWWFWTTKPQSRPVEVTFTSRQEWFVTTAIVVLGWGALYFILTRFTDSEVPVWDSFVSATGWAGMWLLARRKTENWLLLNVSNAFAVPLLFYKGLPLFALLTIFLFIVACFGYVDWVKLARQRNDQPTPDLASS